MGRFFPGGNSSRLDRRSPGRLCSRLPEMLGITCFLKDELVLCRRENDSNYGVAEIVTLPPDFSGRVLPAAKNDLTCPQSHRIFHVPKTTSLPAFMSKVCSITGAHVSRGHVIHQANLHAQLEGAPHLRAGDQAFREGQIDCPRAQDGRQERCVRDAEESWHPLTLLRGARPREKRASGSEWARVLL